MGGVSTSQEGWVGNPPGKSQASPSVPKGRSQGAVGSYRVDRLTYFQSATSSGPGKYSEAIDETMHDVDGGARKQ